MKFRLLLLLFLISSSKKIFASNYIKVSYKTDRVSMNCFLCYAEELSLPDYTEENYKNVENKFYEFLYFVDSFVEISNTLDLRIVLCSEPGLAELAVGENKYIFVSKKRVHEAGSSSENYVLTEQYKNPFFIVPYVCEKLGLQIPQNKTKDRKLFVLEIKSFGETDFSESDGMDIIFFYPGGDVYYSPVFEVKKKIYFGFYYSLEDSKMMQNKLKDKYHLDSTVKELPLDFGFINKGYFKIGEHKTKRGK